jgi:hypothetical protein
MSKQTRLVRERRGFLLRTMIALVRGDPFPIVASSVDGCTAHEVAVWANGIWTRAVALETCVFAPDGADDDADDSDVNGVSVRDFCCCGHPRKKHYSLCGRCDSRSCRCDAFVSVNDAVDVGVIGPEELEPIDYSKRQCACGHSRAEHDMRPVSVRCGKCDCVNWRPMRPYIEHLRSSGSMCECGHGYDSHVTLSGDNERNNVRCEYVDCVCKVWRPLIDPDF